MLTLHTKCSGEIQFDNHRGHVTSATLQELMLEDFGDTNNFIRNRHDKQVRLTIRRRKKSRSRQRP